MRSVALLVLVGVVASGFHPFNPELDAHWENFKRIFDKKYRGSEEGARRLVWEGHVNTILHHNLAADMGLSSFKGGLNEFSDMSHREFIAQMNGLRIKSYLKMNGSSWLAPSNVQYPARVDWREEELVTHVKNQKNCGSCWAFSATGSLEGQHKKKSGQLVSLSEQNLIDCSYSPDGNQGCDGGMMDEAFKYVERNHGIDTEDSYPYTARDGTCHFKSSGIGATCTGLVDILQGHEEALRQAVATVGPISVAIDASVKNFMNYKSGIYDEESCSSYNLDHGVLVVGYGTEDGKDYWLVKNSWGESWGLSGYVKMSRNKNNQCGIASLASYPLV